MYYNTNYQRSGAGALLNYIEREHPLRNSVGREITDREREHFIDKSERHQFEREIRISPDPQADVAQEQLERETQRYVREFTRERTSVQAVYAYHEDNGIPHVHVALTGERRDLFMEQSQLEQERFRLSQRLEPSLVLEQRLEQEYEREQKIGPEHEFEFELENELEQEHQLEYEQRLRQERELEHRIEQTREIEHELRQEQEQEQSQDLGLGW